MPGSDATTAAAKRSAGCMRFLFRFAVLGALGTALLVFVLAVRQHNSLAASRTNGSAGTALAQSAQTARNRAAGPTEEEREVRRLLLEGGPVPDGEPVPAGPGQLVPPGAADNGALLLFPIGRYPAPRVGAGAEFTLNVAIVLVVSLLSIAVLITAICCVIVIALAMDSSGGTPLSSLSPVASSADFLLSSWPHYQHFHQSPTLHPHFAPKTPGLAKLLELSSAAAAAQADAHFIAAENTPPLTDEEEWEDPEEALFRQPMEDPEEGVDDDRQRLVLDEGRGRHGWGWAQRWWTRLARTRQAQGGQGPFEQQLQPV